MGKPKPNQALPRVFKTKEHSSLLSNKILHLIEVIKVNLWKKIVCLIIINNNN